MITPERAEQAKMSERQDSNDAAESNANVYVTIMIIASYLMSMLGFHAMLPNEDHWSHYAMVFVLSGAVFVSLKLLWGAQTELFARLAVGKLSSTAITGHVFAVILTFCISMPTSYVGSVYQLAIQHDFNVAYEKGVEIFEQGNRQFLSTMSVKTLIESRSDKMAGYADDAVLGTLSGQEGKGSIFRTYDEARKSLNRLSEQLQKNEEAYEILIAEMLLVKQKMRAAIDSELNLKEKATAFEAAYSEYAGLYTKLISLDLSRQIDSSLEGFGTETVAGNVAKGNVKSALKLAQKTVRDTVADIRADVQGNGMTLKPMPQYRLGSAEAVSFKYINEFLIMFILAVSLDASLLVVLWLRIAALRSTKEISHQKNDHNQLGELL